MSADGLRGIRYGTVRYLNQYNPHSDYRQSRYANENTDVKEVTEQWFDEFSSNMKDP